METSEAGDFEAGNRGFLRIQVLKYPSGGIMVSAIGFQRGVKVH
jgi:hypothetical protein